MSLQKNLQTDQYLSLEPYKSKPLNAGEKFNPNYSSIANQNTETADTYDTMETIKKTNSIKISDSVKF